MDRIQWLKNNGYCNQDGEIIHTRSTKFLLPLVGITEMDIEKIDKKLLINVHYDFNEEKIIIVVVLNKQIKSEKIDNFIHNQNLNENFDYSISFIEDNDYLLIYNLPSQFKDDFYLFIEGKYSKMSEEYKSIILRAYNLRVYNSVDLKDYRPTISEALYPTDIKRKLMADYYLIDDYRIIDEVSAKPNKQYEAYHTIKELNKKYENR